MRFVRRFVAAFKNAWSADENIEHELAEAMRLKAKYHGKYAQFSRHIVDQKQILEEVQQLRRKNIEVLVKVDMLSDLLLYQKRDMAAWLTHKEDQIDKQKQNLISWAKN